MPTAASSASSSSRSSKIPQSMVQVFNEKAKKLLLEDQVVAVLGCYTSASRQSVLPVFEEHNGLLLYPTLYEAQECSKNCFYTGAVPNQQLDDFVPWIINDPRPQALLPDRRQLHLSEGDQSRSQGAAQEAWRRDGGRGVRAARPHRVLHQHQQDRGERAGYRVLRPRGRSDRRLLQAVPAVRHHRRGPPDLHADHHRAGDRGDGARRTRSVTTPRSTTSSRSIPPRTNGSSSGTRPSTEKIRSPTR